MGVASKGIAPITFNAELHCGARIKRVDPDTGQKMLCKHLKGERTEHPGDGKCWLHGGGTVGKPSGRPIKHGRYSGKLKFTLSDEIDNAQRSPELLSLDREVATLRVIWARQIAQYELMDALHQEYLQAMEDYLNSDEEDDEDEEGGKPAEPPKFVPAPSVDLETLKLLAAVDEKAFNMRFSKRFSISFSELRTIMQQVSAIFGEVCDEFQIPPAARQRFAERFLSEVKISQPFDAQLQRAGEGTWGAGPGISGTPPDEELIEATLALVSGSSEGDDDDDE